MEKKSVLQKWMEDLSWKQQSTLLSSLRGPDTSHCPKLKAINKWIRRVTQNNADTSSPYMKNEQLPQDKEIEKEIEFCSVHYFSHLLEGLEIIGYKHPNNETADTARNYYLSLVNLINLKPESKKQLEERLKDIN